jgi:ligand-binding sensor domain-containing protein
MPVLSFLRASRIPSVSRAMRRKKLRQSEYVRRVLWLAGLWLFMCLNARAERPPIKSYTTADGLAHNIINKIVRDSRGFLWFCTNEGLSRFDGYTFTNYGIDQGLPHAVVSDILETRAGDYWVATNGGLCKFNPRARTNCK